MIVSIKKLRDKGVITEDDEIYGSVRCDEGKIEFRICFDDVNRYIELINIIYDYGSKVKICNDQIKIISRTSNLGKGEIYFFVCPQCLRSCRSIFISNGSAIFKCRQCNPTLLYPTQTSSKMSRANDQFFNVQGTLDRLKAMKHSDTYNGEITKRAKRIKILEEKLEQFNSQRLDLNLIPKKLRNEFIKLIKW